jgi:hypothetical protein
MYARYASRVDHAGRQATLRFYLLRNALLVWVLLSAWLSGLFDLSVNFPLDLQIWW